MPRVAVIGGGLAGLASAVALGSAGFEVDIYESRNFLGGRATSWPPPGEGEMIDNCQHVLLRCCVNLLDLYKRLGVENKIRFYREFHFIEPGGRTSVLKRGRLPAPAHFFGSFLNLKFLSFADKIAIARAVNAIPRERTRADLDRITMLDWLREKRQTAAAIERYWRQVLVSAVNEELDRMAAAHGFQVFWLGMIARADSYEMGIPDVPLRELYDEQSLQHAGKVRVQHRSAVNSFVCQDGMITAISAAGRKETADYYISALPFERLQPLMAQLPVEWEAFGHSPITGIHLWFDRSVTSLPHATLLDRTIQWMFNKSEGRYIQTVVSASRSMVEMPRQDIINLAVKELGEFFPLVKEAKLEKAQVIKEVRATFSATPGLEQLRPPARTGLKNFFLAGDWTRSGWPATMEGAVRSGYLAAEAVAEAAGLPARFLLPDVA
jgi:squalene-associated FAD-dependent desaturase